MVTRVLLAALACVILFLMTIMREPSPAVLRPLMSPGTFTPTVTETVAPTDTPTPEPTGTHTPTNTPTVKAPDPYIFNFF